MTARPVKPPDDPVGLERFGKLDLSGDEATTLTRATLVERLMEAGASRLTAERIVAIERDGAQPGRARPHSQARR